MKLTKAQAEYLHLLAKGDRETWTGYRPGKNLVQLGLAEWATTRGDHRTMSITEAGRKALEESRG